MADLILGIDPGFKGALAIYDPVKKTAVIIRDMPLYMPKGLRRIDMSALSAFVGLYASDIDFCVIENVGAMTYVDRHGEVRGQGAAASFEFGRATGIVQGVVASYNIKTILLHPASWKAGMGLSRDKKESLKKAIQLFPEFRSYFVRIKDDGRAEALLMAVFAARYTGRLLNIQAGDRDSVKENLGKLTKGEKDYDL